MALNDFADTLVRQTWQIALVFGLVWASSAVLRRASAHWRYMLWLLVVTQCLTPPIVDIPIALPNPGTRVASQSAAPQTIADEPMKADASAARFQPPTRSDFAQAQSEPPVANALPTTRVVSQRFTPGLWLVATWLLVTVTILAFVAVSFWATNRRLRRSRVPADDETRNAVETLARRLGITNPPTVYMSSAAVQPFVWGLVRGDIYVPLGFAGHGTKEQRQAVLTHELAHVARCDATVNLIQIVVQALFFFHPLVWWANRRIRHEREKCCDELVLSDTRIEPQLYCHAIVEILASASRQSCWAPALAVTGSTRNIEDRIVTILTPDRKFHRRPSRIAVATILLAGACVLPTGIVLTSRPQSLAAADPAAQEKATAPETKIAPKSEAAAEEKSVTSIPSPWQPGQVMEFRAIDARTREPLPEVTLELQNMGPGIDFGDVKTQTTDANGLSMVGFPDRPAKEVRIYPSKPGYIPLRVFWEGEPHAIMPKTITIPMERGKEFGGIIRNKAGKPISNVTVTVHYWARGTGKNPHIRANIVEKTASDADGRWRLNIMPAEVSAPDLRIYVKHPDYLSDYLPRGYLPFPVIEQPPLDKLFEQSAVMVMSEGEIIEGQVIASQSGLPVPSARVFLSDVPWFDEPRATSDKDGRFKVAGISRTDNGMTRNSNYPLALIVQAAGYAPELFEVKQMSGPVKIQLNPAAAIHGKVVDETGNPVEGATIAADQWRGRQNQLPLKAKSAADGAFTISDAPADRVEYTVHKEGYLVAEHIDMSPSEVAHSVTLKSLVQIVGSVVDAETGKPLERFSVMLGTDYDDGRAPEWMAHDKKTILAGTYVTNIRQEGFKYRIRVAADGYMPGESRMIKPYAPDKGRVTIDFKLHKAPNLAGTVEGLDKRPLSNAEVFLVRGNMNIQNRKVIYVDHADRESVKTDATGRFEFPAEVERFCVIVVHEQGIGMVTGEQFAASSKIAIQPWDQQNERLQIIPRPAPGVTVDFPGKYP